MAGFFETKIENMERFGNKKDSNKGQKVKSNKKRKHFNQNDSEKRSSQGIEDGKKFCMYNGMCGYSTNECTLIKSLVTQAMLRMA